MVVGVNNAQKQLGGTLEELIVADGLTSSDHVIVSLLFDPCSWDVGMLSPS